MKISAVPFIFLLVHYSSNAVDLPDAGKDVVSFLTTHNERPEILLRYTGVSETHAVKTEDGYILTLFRIPRKNPKGVILFHHPVMVDSKVWLLQGNQSTAFIFWRAGYDVWLTNTRGTLYSKRHVYLNHTDPQFWNHSFHEVGLYDQHANIQYVRQITKVPQVIYLGHSVGTTTSLIYASLRPEDAWNSVKIFISLTPSCYFKYFSNSRSNISRFIPIFKNITGRCSLLSHDAPYLRVLRGLPLSEDFRIKFITRLCGGKPENVDRKIFKMWRSQFGSELSWKTLDHYVQLIRNDGEFRMFDYGPENNLKLYGNPKPLLYPIENIRTPFFLIYGSDDNIIHPKNIELLYSRLPRKSKLYGKLQVENYGHISFHLDKDRVPKVYNRILELLDRI